MIEEAAGTRMYESKKQSAQRIIEKKDSKLQEIETVSWEKEMTESDSYYWSAFCSWVLIISFNRYCDQHSIDNLLNFYFSTLG